MGELDRSSLRIMSELVKRRDSGSGPMDSDHLLKATGDISERRPKRRMS